MNREATSARVRVVLLALLALLLPAMMVPGVEAASTLALALTAAVATVALVHLSSLGNPAVARRHTSVPADASDRHPHLTARVIDPVASPCSPRAPGQV